MITRRVLAVVAVLPLLLGAAPVPVGTIAGPFGTPALGEWVSFDATWSKTVHDPRIGVECYQDGTLVYAMFDAPASNRSPGTVSLELGGGSSAWRTNGGPAQCVGWLKDYVGAPWTRRIVDLAEVSFSAAG